MTCLVRLLETNFSPKFTLVQDIIKYGLKNKTSIKLLWHYEFLVIPFGLTSALATFMNMMNNMLSKFLDRFVMVFLDDILIYSKNEEEHEEHLWRVFQNLREHQLYAKLSKCDFYKKKVQYFGHVILERGVPIDPVKIKVIIEWLVLKDVHDIKSFMGLMRYYHRFIEFSSRIAYPITTLQNKSVWFICSQKYQDSFDQLKQLLTTTTILRIVIQRNIL